MIEHAWCGCVLPLGASDSLARFWANHERRHALMPDRYVVEYCHVQRKWRRFLYEFEGVEIGDVVPQGGAK